MPRNYFEFYITFLPKCGKIFFVKKIPKYFWYENVKENTRKKCSFSPKKSPLFSFVWHILPFTELRTRILPTVCAFFSLLSFHFQIHRKFIHCFGCLSFGFFSAYFKMISKKLIYVLSDKMFDTFEFIARFRWFCQRINQTKRLIQMQLHIWMFSSADIWYLIHIR